MGFQSQTWLRTSTTTTHLPEWLELNEWYETRCWRGWGLTTALISCCWGCKLVHHFVKPLGHISKPKRIPGPWLSHFTPTEMSAYVHQNAQESSVRQPNCPTEEQRISIFTQQMHAHAQSCLTLCDPMDCSPQAPWSIRFSRQGYRRGLPCPPPRDLPNPGIKLYLPYCRRILYCWVTGETPHNGLSNHNRKEWTTDTYNNMDEPLKNIEQKSQTQKFTYSRIPCVWS